MGMWPQSPRRTEKEMLTKAMHRPMEAAFTGETGKKLFGVLMF